MFYTGSSKVRLTNLEKRQPASRGSKSATVQGCPSWRQRDTRKFDQKSKPY